MSGVDFLPWGLLLIADLVPWLGIFLLLDEFIQIVEHQFYVLALVGQLLFDLLYLQSKVQVVGQHFTKLGKDPHDLDVHGNRFLAVQYT